MWWKDCGVCDQPVIVGSMNASSGRRWEDFNDVGVAGDGFACDGFAGDGFAGVFFDVFTVFTVFIVVVFIVAASAAEKTVKPREEEVHEPKMAVIDQGEEYDPEDSEDWGWSGTEGCEDHDDDPITEFSNRKAELVPTLQDIRMLLNTNRVKINQIADRQTNRQKNRRTDRSTDGVLYNEHKIG